MINYRYWDWDTSKPKPKLIPRSNDVQDEPEHKLPHIREALKKETAVDLHEKWIVVTSIFQPTPQMVKLSQIPGWKLLVVADQKPLPIGHSMTLYSSTLRPRKHSSTMCLNSSPGMLTHGRLLVTCTPLSTELRLFMTRTTITLQMIFPNLKTILYSKKQHAGSLWIPRPRPQIHIFILANQRCGQEGFHLIKSVSPSIKRTKSVKWTYPSFNKDS